MYSGICGKTGGGVLLPAFLHPLAALHVDITRGKAGGG